MMFKHQGIWLPDGEAHFPEWMTKNGEIVDGKGTYQIKKLRKALEHCKQFRVAVDVGAHVGFWTMQMLKRFQLVHSFEPVVEFVQCWTRNVDIGKQVMCDVDAGEVSEVRIHDRGAILYGVALGAERGKVAMKTPGLDGGVDTGGTHVSGVGDISMYPLDEFDFHDVDFIKIDCEGYEHRVIEGARETIARWRPTIIVEQKPHKLGPNFGIKGTPALDLLKSMGGTVRAEISGDYIVTFG
jgi:FkbM family methyltransferase